MGKPGHKEEICLGSELMSILGEEFGGFWFPVWDLASRQLPIFLPTFFSLPFLPPLSSPYPLQTQTSGLKLAPIAIAFGEFGKTTDLFSCDTLFLQVLQYPEFGSVGAATAWPLNLSPTRGKLCGFV